MEKLREGFVVVLKSGLKVLRTSGGPMEVVTLDQDTTVVVEQVRVAPPGSEDDHFLESGVFEGRVLREDGQYDHEMPRYMFAQYGDFAPEFIQTAFTVVKKMRRTYTDWN